MYKPILPPSLACRRASSASSGAHTNEYPLPVKITANNQTSIYIPQNKFLMHALLSKTHTVTSAALEEGFPWPPHVSSTWYAASAASPAAQPAARYRARPPRRSMRPHGVSSA